MATTLPLLLSLFLSLTSALPSPPQLSPSDFAVLFDLKQALTDLPGSDFLSTWTFSSPSSIAIACTSFSGVLCSLSPDLSSLRVTSLSLPSLSGHLPSSLSNLSLLSQLIISPGRISGPLPPSLSFLPQLRLLSITGNLLSGQIPFIPLTSKLHTLDLSHNGLSGPLSNGLLSLPSLRVLILAGNNKLQGELPSVTSPLLHLDLRENNFSGPLPPSLPSSLRYLSLSKNSFSGPLEPLSGSFPDLAFLDISFNGFSGRIPGSVFGPRRPVEDQVPPPVAVILLHRNRLSGELPLLRYPAAMARWTVDLSHNRISGGIPPQLSGVEALFLNNNRLTGAVPHELIRSLYEGQMMTFYVQHNFLSEVEWTAPMPPLPAGVTACLAFNCVGTMPEGPSGCPTGGGGRRPAEQCSAVDEGAVVLDEDEI